MFKLLRYFSLASALAVLAVTVVFVVVHRQYAVGELVQMEEAQNVALAQAFANSIWPRFAPHLSSARGLGVETLRNHPETRRLGRALRQLAAGLPVLKVKIYDPDGRVVYSSEAAEIGSDASGNAGFQTAARGGRPVSELVFRNTFDAFEGLVRDRDLVESYVPVRWGPEQAPGVFELYSDVTALLVRIGRTTLTLVAAFLLGFAVLYGVLFLIVRRADRILAGQYEGLQLSEERMREKNIALEGEIAERKQAEAALQETKDDLEIRVIERTRALQRNLLNQEIVASILGLSLQPLGLDEVLDQTLKFVLQSPGLDFEAKGAIFLVTDDPKTLVLEAQQGFSDALIRECARVPFGHCLCGRAAQSASILFCDSMDERHDTRIPDMEPHGHYCAPIRSEGELLGVLSLYVPEGHERVAAEEMLVKTIADTLAGVIRRKRAEEILMEAKELAESANRAKTEFLANMSHELRTPLNSVIGFSDILTDESRAPLDRAVYAEYARDINESGKHLLELINDILDVAKIESGTLTLATNRLDVSRMIGSCARLVEEQVRHCGLRLELEVPELLPVLTADERRVKQILLNLLSNAIKFTPDGGTVTLRVATDGAVGMVFSVSDTGIGIAPENVPHALSKFGQVEGSYTRQHQGAGLGLPLVKSLVELHGGSLAIDSAVGAGTTVSLAFPLDRVRPAP